MAKDQENKEKEQKQPEFTGEWFQPGQEVTKADLLAKLAGVEERFASEIKGDNWWVERQEYEARENQKKAMRDLFDAGMQKMTPEGKRRVYESISEKGRAAADKEALKDYARLLNGKDKSAESKKLSDKIWDEIDTITVDQVKEMASGFLTEEEKKNPKIDPTERVKFDELGSTDMKLWTAFVEALPEDAVKDAALAADNHVDQLKRPIEDVRILNYSKEVEDTKRYIDTLEEYNGEKLTSERKEELKAKLDRANELTASTDKQYESALGDVNIARSEYSYSATLWRKKVAEETLRKDGINVRRDGKGINFLEVENTDGGYLDDGNEPIRLKTIPEKGKAQFDKMKEYNFQMRPETKQAIKDIFAKFDKYGFDSNVFVPEEGTKVYGFHRFVSASKEFKSAIASQDPADRLKAVEAAEKLQVETNRVKELMSDARKIFGVDNGGFYPGNLDLEREDKLYPPELRADIAGTSCMNGLYILYRTVKEEKIDLDTFLDNPRTYVRGKMQEKIEKLDVNKTIKGKSGAEAIFELAIPDYAIDPIGGLSLGRTMETIAKAETDPEMQKHNMGVEYAHELTDEYVLNATSQRRTLLHGGMEHFDRYLMVSEPQEDASLLGLRLYDYDTMTLKPAREFDEVGYLSEKREPPEQYADRITNECTKLMTMMLQDGQKPKGQRMIDSSEMPVDAVLWAAHNAAAKYLAVFPDIDKKSEAYKTLHELAYNNLNFFKEKMEQINEKNGYGFDLEEAFDSAKNRKTKQTIDEFKKSNAIRRLGDGERAADKQLNAKLKGLSSELEKAKKDLDKAKDGAGKEQAQKRVDEAQKKLSEAVAERKEQLLESFHRGDISEEYLNRRGAQLDDGLKTGKFDDKVPKMFEADELLGKNDYLKKQFPDDYADFSKEEKEELYNRYVERAKLAKDEFIARKYLRNEGTVSEKTFMTKEERIAAEDERLLRKDPDAVQKPKGKEEVNKNEKDAVQIEIDPEQEEKEVAEEKTEQKDKGEAEKAIDEEKTDLNKDVVPVVVDLEENEVELGDDMLSFGKEKAVEKDSPKIDV